MIANQVRRAPTRGGGAFTPADLFTSGQRGFWRDFTDISTLFQDTAGLVPVTADGQTYLRVNDKSGNGNHGIASSTGAVYKAGAGIPYQLLDGVADGFINTSVDHSSDMDHFLTILRDASDGTFLPSWGHTGSLFYAAAQSGSGAAPHQGTGSSVSYIVDESIVSPVTRDALNTALSLSSIHQLEVYGLDLTSWTSFNEFNYAAGFALKGNVYGSVLRDSFSAEEITLLRAYMASLVA